jgi:hypothetical protein
LKTGIKLIFLVFFEELLHAGLKGDIFFMYFHVAEAAQGLKGRFSKNILFCP